MHTLNALKMQLLIACIVMFCPFMVVAQTSDRNFVNTIEGCQIHIWPSSQKTKVSWSGACISGKTAGLGTMVWIEINERTVYTYYGYMADGKFNGEGILFDGSNRIVEQGNWVNDKLRNAYLVNLPSHETNKAAATLAWQRQKEIEEQLRQAQESRKKEQDRILADQKANEQKRLFEESQIKEQQRLAIEASEISRLRAEAEEAKRKQTELEEQLRQTQQGSSITTQTASIGIVGRRIALVVGNANYKVRPLKNPRNDADDVSRSLKATGFEVIDLRDATLPQMRTAVRLFGDRLINNDVGLVYYSGHGVEVKGRNYFIPVNADIQREDEIADQGLDVSLILEKMSTAGKGVNILIVDACRDDPFGRSFRSSSRGLANMDAPRGTIIAYATSPGKVASDGDPRERNSPYTKHLVKAMQSPNKPIEQVFKEVRRAVQDETKNQQTPWENTSLSGDFFFSIKK
jgi:hypothetical protein